MEFMYNNYGIEAKGDSLSKSLRQCGIGSLEAAEIAFFLSNCSIHTNLADVIQYALDEKITLGEFLNHFNITTSKTKINLNNYQQEYKARLQFNKLFPVMEKWYENLGKCIDGSPVYSNGYK